MSEKKTVVEKVQVEVIGREITTWITPENPSWDRARTYAVGIKRGADDVVRLGMELAGLRKQHISQGARNDISTSSQGAMKLEMGWQEKVRAELGISKDTAYRIMEKAEIIVALRRLKSGEPIPYKPKGSDEQRILEPTPDVLEQADRALDEITAGTISPPRAWAGMCGEAMRRKGGTARAPIDHAKNIRDALVKLNTSLPKWNKLDPASRHALEELWGDVSEKLPGTWR